MVTCPTGQVWVHIDTIPNIQAKDAVADHLDNASRIKPKDTWQLGKGEASSTPVCDEVVGVWHETTSLDLDQNICESRHRLVCFADLQGFAKCDDSRDVDFGCASRHFQDEILL